jgi:hypothetical protein
MFGSKTDTIKNPNEVVFSKTKGFGSVNYGTVTTKALFNETSVLVERISKVLFFKGKPETNTVEFNAIENVAVKNHFSKGDLISGIVLGALALIMASTGAFGDENPGIIVGPIIIAVMVFASYGKNAVITKKNGDRINLLSEGFAQSEQIETFLKKLEEKGVSVQRGKR